MKVCLLVLILSLSGTVISLDNGLALTPPMGWSTWNALHHNISQDILLSQIQGITRKRNGRPSLFDVGYTHVNIDGGWENCGAGVNKTFHNSSGFPIINTTMFPNMAKMTKQAHQLGVKMGWYFNNCGCNAEHVFDKIGGHPVEDSEMTAFLEFDGIKIDGCGPALDIVKWKDALNATARPMLIEDCLDKRYYRRHEKPPIHSLAELVRDCPSNFYRISKDIKSDFYSTVFNVNFGENLLAPYRNVTHPASRPGCWSYPDQLEVGNLPSLTESQTHFAMWCITSSPLLLGFDLTNNTVYDQLYPIITNKRALNVNQQWAGSPGGLVTNATKSFESKGYGRFPVWQIWSKPLPSQDGKTPIHAVLLINLSDKKTSVPLVYRNVDPALGENVIATNVWSGNRVQTGMGNTTFSNLKAHDSVFLLLNPTK